MKKEVVSLTGEWKLADHALDSALQRSKHSLGMVKEMNNYMADVNRRLDDVNRRVQSVLKESAKIR